MTEVKDTLNHTSANFYNDFNVRLAEFNEKIKDMIIIGDKISCYSPKVYGLILNKGIIYNAIVKICNKNSYLHIPNVFCISLAGITENIKKKIYENSVHPSIYSLLDANLVSENINKVINNIYNKDLTTVHNMPTIFDVNYNYTQLSENGLNCGPILGYYLQGVGNNPVYVRDYTRICRSFLPNYLIDSEYHNSDTRCLENNYVYYLGDVEEHAGYLDPILIPLDVKVFDSKYEKEIKDLEALLSDTSNDYIKDSWFSYFDAEPKPSIPDWVSPEFKELSKDIPDDILKELNWGA